MKIYPQAILLQKYAQLVVRLSYLTFKNLHIKPQPEYCFVQKINAVCKWTQAHYARPNMQLLLLFIGIPTQAAFRTLPSN